MKIRIAIIDDHAILREGLRHLLATIPRFEVVSEAASGMSALAVAEAFRPEVMIMDIAMPDLNGIEATREIVARYPKTKVVILSVYSTSEHIHQAFAAGASGYVLKESAGRELVDAILAALGNKRYLSEKIDENLLTARLLSENKSPLACLSARERQVLLLVVDGSSSAIIAEKLALSPKTVETYRSRIMQKLNLRNITDLIKFAIQHGLTAA